ncbi:4Fe-4S dicluster domain-containing protein [Candidatus Woesearchaeota archaeon]|nr:4Fe-4S dicluster domain-containing protein [Candidatus Woesearchaeota archaeon]
MGKLLKKSAANDFFRSLQKKGSLYAPVSTDMVRFQHIKTPEALRSIDFDGHAFFPPKKYLLPNEEELFTIKQGKLQDTNQSLPPQFVVNVRLCDLNAIAILDKLYLDPDYPDPYYKAKRDATTFIGINCKREIDEYCFCGSMDLQRAYDLLLDDRGEHYYIDVRSDKGMALVKELPDAPEQQDPTLPKTSKVLDQKDLHQFFADKWWEGDNELCVSCQRCTALCPTCFCFDVKDDMDLNLQDGKRLRTIDSCHSADFTTVAGDHTFRSSRLQRYRHRVMHKLQYYKDTFERSMCTGCGRCIRYCHSKIDFVKTINEDFK